MEYKKIYTEDGLDERDTDRKENGHIWNIYLIYLHLDRLDRYLILLDR